MVARESFEAEKFSSGEKTPTPLKMKKNVCLKMLFSPFRVILAYVFLSGKLTDTDPNPNPNPPASIEENSSFL